MALRTRVLDRPSPPYAFGWSEQIRLWKLAYARFAEARQWDDAAARAGLLAAAMHSIGEPEEAATWRARRLECERAAGGAR